MKVALVEAILIHLYSRLNVLLHLQILMDDECTARLDECGIVAEALKICFFGAVDVKMVGVG